MHAFRAVNLGVRFLLEFGALAAFAYWGATFGASAPMHTTLAMVQRSPTATRVGGEFRNM